MTLELSTRYSKKQFQHRKALATTCSNAGVSYVVVYQMTKVSRACVTLGLSTLYSKVHLQHWTTSIFGWSTRSTSE